MSRQRRFVSRADAATGLRLAILIILVMGPVGWVLGGPFQAVESMLLAVVLLVCAVLFVVGALWVLEPHFDSIDRSSR